MTFDRLTYKDGKLYWKNGKEAGTKTENGYIRVKYLGRSYMAHVIIWAMFHGSLPDHQVDHKNRVRDDNRIENLRLATHGENVANSKMRSNNTSGDRGVYPRGDYFVVVCGGEYVGHFASRSEAKDAYANKAKERWGEFAPI